MEKWLIYYEEENSPYFGALIGRFANRIAGGNFSIDDHFYSLATNNGPNHLHGGITGWDKAIWKARQGEDYITFSHFSPDGDEGYPGDVEVTVTYQLTNQNEVIINYTAHVHKKATPINLSSHCYFNLAGEQHGTSGVYDHQVEIFADYYLPVTADQIPTGDISPVEDTVFDLRSPQILEDVIHNVTGGGKNGYDHNFCIRGPTGKRKAARVYHPGSGRVMEVYSTQPGLQFYTGNFLDLNKGQGKHGHSYPQHAGFCMETQNYPDAVNHENFPDSILRPGSTYEQQTWYKFYTLA